MQQAVERFADATATKCFPSSRCASAIQINGGPEFLAFRGGPALP